MHRSPDPLPHQHRRPAARVLLLALALAGLTALAPRPAAGQVDPNELPALEARRDEIIVRLGELDTALAAVDDEIDRLDDELHRADLRLELVADEFERAADARREPAATRVQMAIAGYMRGDPRANALLDELASLGGGETPARKRALYDAVIDDAEKRLAAVDARLAELHERVAVERGVQDDLRAARADAESRRQELGAERTALAQELDEVTARIETLRALENRALLTGLLTYDDPSRPALAVKIDNVDAAHPQAGINAADVVFEEEVEGGLTRLAAVFHSTGAEVVGPVRSMRTTDFTLLAQLNHPLFANSGGNPRARRLLEDSDLVDVGAASLPAGYYRDRSRRAPHNLFTNTFNLWALGAELGAGSPPPLFTFRLDGGGPPAEARPASGVRLDFGRTTVSYTWNGTGWARTQNGHPHVDTGGAQVAPANVIVQFVDYGVSPADAQSPEAITVGSGQAWILSEGTVMEATWRRDDAASPTEYVDARGNPVSIAVGRTWIELPRPGAATLS